MLISSDSIPAASALLAARVAIRLAARRLLTRRQAKAELRHSVGVLRRPAGVPPVVADLVGAVEAAAVEVVVAGVVSAAGVEAVAVATSQTVTYSSVIASHETADVSSAATLTTRSAIPF
jgi:hypothetical protein